MCLLAFVSSTAPGRAEGTDHLTDWARRLEAIQAELTAEQWEAAQVAAHTLTGEMMFRLGRAAEAVCQWRFEPAKLGGVPVEVYHNLVTYFGLEKK